MSAGRDTPWGWDTGLPDTDRVLGHPLEFVSLVGRIHRVRPEK